MLNPTWMLDDPNADPLLQQLEEERRRRAVEQAQAAQPVEAAPFVAPLIPTPGPAEQAADDIERQQRDAQAQVDFAKAQAADAGIDLSTGLQVQAQPQAQATPAPLDTGVSFKGGTGTVTEQVHSWDPMVQAASAAYNVPTNVIKAIIDIESKGDPGATSHAGAAGLMQVMPFHAKNGEDLYDPVTNIDFGTRILAENYARYGTWEQAAAAYFGAINPDGSVSGASDGNADGYTYVDLFTSKANAYLSDQREQAPTYGPSLPSGSDARAFGDQRPSQLPEANPELSMDAAYAACGPAAAIVFAAMMGRPPTLKEATEIGRSIKAWDEGVGMYGPEAEIRLIEALGGRARFQPGLDPNLLVAEVANGNPVMLSSPRTASSEGHYAVVSGFDQASGRFYFGTSATDLKGGQAWMTLEEYQALRASGPVTGMILVDNPLAQGPSAASERYGPSIPPSWDPARQGIDKPQQQESDFQRLAREQWQAAQDLAVKVADQVERIREEARKQQESQVQAPPTERYQPTDDPAQAEMLRQPLAQPDSTRQDATSEQEQTDQFVARAREIEARYPDAEARKDDPNYQLEVTRLAREWQQAANGDTLDTREHPELAYGYRKQPDGTFKPLTSEEYARAASQDPTLRIADQELANREQYLQRQIETRAEQAQVGNIWTLTPDEYTAWRKRQGLEIRPDEYQRHAIAVMEAAQQGQAIPDKVKEAYGSEVKDRWQKDRRSALSPIAAVANGAPYDGADAEHRYQGLAHLPTQARVVAQQTADVFGTALDGMLRGIMSAGAAGQDFVERRTGTDFGDGLNEAIERSKRYTAANPQQQSPDRPPEDFWGALQYSSGIEDGGFRLDRFLRSAAQLGPYLIGSTIASAVAAPAVTALGLTGMAATIAASIASGLAVTGTTSFGNFYDEAINADPKQGQRRLSKDEAMAYAGLSALVQTGIEVAFGRSLGRVAQVGLERSPVMKKASELMARNWVARIVGEGASESFLEEAPQQVMENLVAKISYDPGRDILDGVGAAIGSTFGPSAAMGMGGAKREAREASFRYATTLDDERKQQLREQVTDVASAEKFANEQLARTAAYGKSVGWDQRQIDAAQFRAAQAIYGYGVDREIAARNLTNEQAVADPVVAHGIFAVRLAKQFENRLNDRGVYEREQRIKERGQQIDALLEKEGIRFEGAAEAPQAQAAPVRMGSAVGAEAAAPVRSFEEVEAAFDRGERPTDAEIDAHYERTYHGTGAAFDRIEPSVYGDGGPGVYVTTEPGRASGYAAMGGEDPSRRPENVAQNIRQVLLPRNLQLIDLQDPIGPRSGREQADEIEEAILNDAELGDESTRRTIATAFRSEMFKKHDPAYVADPQYINTASHAVRQALESALPGIRSWTTDGRRAVNSHTNRILANAGFDGIDARETGGQQIIIFPQSLDKIRNGFAGTRGGSSTATSRVNPTGPNDAFPATTARTGDYVAPGLETGGFKRNADGVDSLQQIDADTTVPVQGTDAVVMGRGGTPASVLMRVANSTYAAGFLQTARTILHGADGQPGAMAILQRIIDHRRRDLPYEKRQPRAEPKIDALGASVQEYYGWNLSPEGRGIGLNPAEMFHAAVVKVAKYEQLNGQLSDQERDEMIVKEMASMLVSNVFHEGAHYYGLTDADVNESVVHTGIFRIVHAPIVSISEMIDKELVPDSPEFNAAVNNIMAQHGLRASQVLQVYNEIKAMREQATSALREAFGTMNEGAGLKEINEHAFEQRMLANEAYVRQNYPQGVENEVSVNDDQQPVDGDGGGGSVLPSGDRTELDRSGDDGAGLQHSEGVAPVGPDAQGADGLGPADAVGGESDAPGNADAAGNADGSAADLTDPLGDQRMVDGLRRILVGGNKYKDKDGKQRTNPGLLRFIADIMKEKGRNAAVVESIRRASLLRQNTELAAFLDAIDPGVLRMQLNLESSQASTESLDLILRALYPDAASVAPSLPPLDYFVTLAKAAIDAEADDPADDSDGRIVMTPERLDSFAGTRGISPLQRAVMEELRRQLYVNASGVSTTPADRAQARAEAEKARAEERRRRQQEQADRQRQAEQQEQPSTGQQEATPRTAREQGATETLDSAAAKINDDDWLDRMSRDTGERWGMGLAEALIVASPDGASKDGVAMDKKATAARRNDMLNLIQDRIKDLSARLRDLRAANLRTSDEGEKQRIKDEIDLLSRRRTALNAIKKGFGPYARKYTTLEDNGPGQPPTAVVRSRVAGDGTTVVVVEGIGAMVAGDGLSAEERLGFKILGQYVAGTNSPGVWGYDDDGRPLTMGGYLSQAIEMLYPGQEIAPEQYFADMQAVAKRWRDANPNVEITQPRLMAHLLLAHQSMVQQAMTAMTSAKLRDKENGSKGELIKDDDGKIIGYGGPEYANALRALHDLVATSAVLPSIRKMATASSRTLRVMQAAEDRNRARYNLMALHEMRTTTRELIKRLEKVDPNNADIDDLLSEFGIVMRGSGSGSGGRATIGQALGRATTQELAGELLVRPDGLFAALSDLYNRVTSVADLNRHFKATDEEGRHFLTKAQRDELKEMLERELRGEVIPEADVRRMTDNIMRGGFRLWARREQDSTVGPDGRTRYASEKARWRAEGENFAIELINRRVDTMTASAVRQTLRLLQEGKDSFLATFDEVMKDIPPGATGKSGMTREQLLAALYAKRSELLVAHNKFLEAQDKPPSRRLGEAAGTGTEKPKRNLQEEMGEQYRREISLDQEIRTAKQWLADAEAAEARGAPHDDIDAIQAMLDDLQAERDEVMIVIDGLETDIVVESLDALIKAVDESTSKRDEAEAKMSDEAVTQAVALHLGYAAAKRVNLEMLRTALSNRDIGRVEAEARELLKAHYHETADESNEVEYWIGFIEDIERKYGASTDVQVQQRLAEMRERAATHLMALDEHPQYGEQMSTALKNRLLRAVHGDAGAFALGIRQQLTTLGYLINETTHPDERDRQYLLRDDVLAAVAGTRADPGPLARAMADRFDTQAMADLNAVLDSIAAEARGLGGAFRDAILAGVDVEHRKAAIREMLPAVKDDPTDMALRYMIEMQLLELRKVLSDRETQTWFRRRFGRAELALRREYERMLDIGVQRIERDIERAVEAANTYDVLAAAGVETVADLTNAVEGKPPKKSASEIIIERRERMAARNLERRIRAIERQRGDDPDAFNRELLDDERDRLLIELESVGSYNDPETGEPAGVGPKAAARLRDELVSMRQRAEDRQEERQVGWEVKDEIRAVTARIKEVHKRLLAGHPGDETGSIAAALQAELDNLMSDLASIGSELTVTSKDGKTSQPLRDAGLKAAQALARELDLRATRFEEREDTRRGRREAVLEARQLRREAMVLVRALVKDPADRAARAELDEILAEMAEIVYLEAQDQEITDIDPTNGGIIGRRTERVDVIVPYGREQADKIAEMARVRFGTTLDDLDRMSQAGGLTRDDKDNLIEAIKDRLARRAAAARESDTFSRRADDVKELLAILRRLDASGQVAEAEERKKLRSTGGRRAMLDDSEQGKRMFAFFDMIQPTADPVTGEMRVDTASVARAIRLVTYPSWASYYREYGIVAMLSSPTTWGLLGVNTIGQLLNAVISPSRFMLKLGIDKVRGDVFGAQRTVYGSEVGAGLRALTPELIHNTVKDAWSIWLNGRSVRQLNDAAETGDAAKLRPEYLVDWTDREGAGWRAIHLLARIGHMGSLRILKAADEFFGSLAYAVAFEAQMERKIKQTGKSRLDVANDPVLMDDVVRRAGHIEKSLLFQEQGKVLSKVNTVLYTLSGERDPRKRTVWHDLSDVILSTYVPFTTVPFNSLKQSIELSGVGTIYHTARAVEKSAKGYGNLGKATAREAAERDLSAARMRAFDPDNDLGKRRALYESEQISDHLSKAALGAMVQAVGWLLASAGLVTGDEPEEPEGRAVDETEKLQPRSIKIGNRWYSYDSTPFAVPFAIAGNYFDGLAKARRDAEKKAAGAGSAATPYLYAVGSGVRSAIFHNFFLENVMEAAQSLVSPDSKTSGEQAAYSVLSPWVTRNSPAILAYFARQGDALERDTRADDANGLFGNVDERLWNLAKSRLPVSRETLPAKMNVLGQEVERKQPFGAGLIAYSKSQQAEFDALLRVVEAYGIEASLTPSKTASQPGRKDGSFDLTLEEQRIWQKAFGENLRREVARTYNDTATFNNVANVASGQDPKVALKTYQRGLLQQAIERARGFGNAAVLQSIPDNPPGRRLGIIEERIAEARKKRSVTESDFK